MTIGAGLPEFAAPPLLVPLPVAVTGGLTVGVVLIGTLAVAGVVSLLWRRFPEQDETERALD